MRHRRIDVERDRASLLELHCCINYESETPYARRMPYAQYRETWLGTSQPDSYLSHLVESLQDPRTIAEVVEEDGAIVGYLWVTFTDLEDYGLTIAEVMDIAVTPDYQCQGVASELLRRAEVQARRAGATLLRSDTGVENVASQRLHDKLEFRPYRIHYEKVLRYAVPSPAGDRGTFARALERARTVLRRHGYEYDIAVEDLEAYARADTLYPSAISWEEILANPLIVAHEVVEIAELTRMGLAITPDVIVRNVDEVYRAHLVAGEVEVAIALATGDVAHLRHREKAVQDWLADPLVPAALRERYEALGARVRRAGGPAREA
jgi:ribosomal protein S18 acetylase RimI-like enzyme